MSLRMERSEIKQSQGFQAFYISLHSSVYFSQPTYHLENYLIVMPRPKPRRPDKQRSSGQVSFPNPGRVRPKSKAKPTSKGNVKIDKLNQFPEKYKTVVICSLVAYLAAALAWVTDAPKEVVWVFILVPVPWIFVHTLPLEERYTKITERLIFIFSAAVLVIILGFSRQSVINLDNNPKIELLKELIGKLFR
jgi:hypothetical protein